MDVYRPSFEEVQVLAEQSNLIPIWRELPADLETPVSVYLKLRGEAPSFLLESVEKGEQLGRYSFLGVEPAAVLTVRDGRVSLQQAGATHDLASEGPDPLSAAKQMLSAYRPAAVEGLPNFTGGLVGYVAYETVRFFERVPLAAQDTLDLPDVVLLLADTVLVFDHVTHRILVVTNAHVDGDVASAYARATSKISAVISRLRQPLPIAAVSPVEPVGRGGPWASTFEQPEFEAAVRRAKEYIAAGDIFQVVLSQRLSRHTAADPFTIYRALRMLNPSPYMFYLDLPGDLRMIGSSPEVLVRMFDRQAEVRPIAGTRPRGANAAEDEALAEELLADPKERAEHVMLVDLGRNDLGRVSRFGSVELAEHMTVHRFSHVMHLVSRVRGVLRDDVDALDALYACFPAGTVSGAPKVRAMEIIEELEAAARGVYAGAVGYLDYRGDLDTCIAIRTVLVIGGQAHVQAGAGIVYDSVPEAEYEETANKARALLEAIRWAHAGVLGGGAR